MKCSVKECTAPARKRGKCSRHDWKTQRASRPLLATWKSMKQRCSDPNSKDFPRYGGRGIKVCLRWANSYEAFATDMGPKPSPRHSVDRINNDGPYAPSNCRWALGRDQNLNTLRKPFSPRVLDADQVFALRRTFETGVFTIQQIAKWFSISSRTVGQISRRETWKHVA